VESCCRAFYFLAFSIKLHFSDLFWSPFWPFPLPELFFSSSPVFTDRLHYFWHQTRSQWLAHLEMVASEIRQISLIDYLISLFCTLNLFCINFSIGMSLFTRSKIKNELEVKLNYQIWNKMGIPFWIPNQFQNLNRNLLYLVHNHAIFGK